MLLVLLILSRLLVVSFSIRTNCCYGEHSVIDCRGGVIVGEKKYYCLDTDVVDGRCINCLTPPGLDGTGSEGDSIQCISCCSTLEGCELSWSWGALLATLSITSIFACCTGVFAIAEKKRRRKGLSLARAWSIPQGIPVLRSTVADLSGVVRSGGPWGWGRDGDGCSDDLEHVGLLEGSCGEYGSLGGEGGEGSNGGQGGDVVEIEENSNPLPLAKLAETGVQAVALESPNYEALLGLQDPYYLQAGVGLRAGGRARGTLSLARQPSPSSSGRRLGLGHSRGSSGTGQGTMVGGSRRRSRGGGSGGGRDGRDFSVTPWGSGGWLPMAESSARMSSSSSSLSSLEVSTLVVGGEGEENSAAWGEEVQLLPVASTPGDELGRLGAALEPREDEGLGVEEEVADVVDVFVDVGGESEAVATGPGDGGTQGSLAPPAGAVLLPS